MKIIDAHAHIGRFGGWFNVGTTVDELMIQMDKVLQYYEQNGCLHH